jgi:hypothetical protein
LKASQQSRRQATFSPGKSQHRSSEIQNNHHETTAIPLFFNPYLQPWFLLTGERFLSMIALHGILSFVPSPTFLKNLLSDKGLQ